MNIQDLTEEQLTSASFYQKLQETDVYKDPMTREEVKYKILKRAKELRIKQSVDTMLKQLEKKMAEIDRESKQRTLRSTQSIDQITNFEPDTSGKSYPNLYCKNWVATEDGIYSMESSRTEQQACFHPILPVRRLRNMEDGKEQLVIAFKRDGAWSEITVPKSKVANSRSIIDLASYGVGVTSESARLLVKFLSDVESANEDIIELHHSSSKLGWHGNDFLPYDTKIIFDASDKFYQLYKSIKECGSFDVWLRHIKKIRADKYIEPKIALAASFSSVIIDFLGIACVVLDSSGSTEAGKTVSHMVATSVWGDPAEGQYMGDFLTTDTALETRCDFLNSLPLILDDTSKMRKSIRDNIEQVVYNLSSGSGKKRSDVNLGNDRVRTWKNTVIINGERPLSSFCDQGGALNRIIEIDLTGVTLFEDPSLTADIVRNNYGFAGKMFVEKIKTMDKQEIRNIHKSYCEELRKANKDSMQKQVLSLAAILTADRIATEVVFKDENNLTVEETSRFLAKRSMVDEGRRCYEFILDFYEEKGQHFDQVNNNVDQYGFVEADLEGKKYLNFNSAAFDRVVKEAGFNRKAFTAWAKREGLLRHAKGRDTYQIKKADNGVSHSSRFVSFLLVDDVDDFKSEKEMFQ